MKKSKILIISTGGTISSKYVKNQGYSPALTIQDIISNFSKLEDIAIIETLQFCNVLSFRLTPQNILDIINIAKKKTKEQNYSGVVVTLGTAAIEEASYLADLLWNMDAPIVFTGAMLNASEREWDGPRNVFHSILIAASSEAKSKGVLVCLGGEIHAARDVIKIHKTSLNAFVSPNNGPLGFVLNNNKVVFYRVPIFRKTFEIEYLETNVDIIKIGLGTNSKIIDFLISNGTKAIVLEAFPGGGGVTPDIMNSVVKAKKKDVVFIVTPRSILGSSISKAGGGCGPADLFKVGVINGGDLSSTKIRILLMVILPITQKKDEIQQIIYKIAP
jgi:L-asparaginase